jgi:hypothetical protein
VHTNPAIGMSSTYANNYLTDPTWGKSLVPRPRDPIFSTAAVGDLSRTGALDIVASTASGYTYAWDGLGHLLSGFPLLNGTPSQFGLTVPPPDTPYSFMPENYTAASPVLAHLVRGSPELDIVQAAGDNHIYAWRPNGSAVPGWPVSTLLPPGTVPAGQQQTHDSKVVPTPAIVDINGDGIPDVVVGLDDSILGTGPAGAGVIAFVEAFDGRGTTAGGTVTGNSALLTGYPVKIQGLLQGYGVAQDFVTQGVESPAVYNDPNNGPTAVVNANLFLPFTIKLKTATVSSNPFAATTIPAAPAGEACPTPGSVPPVFPGPCALVQFTTSASLGKLVSSTPTPDAFQMGSSSADVFLGITQTPGYGIRVDNGIGAWDPTSGSSLSQFSHYVQGLSFFAAPAIADVTGDGTPDVIVPADSGAIMAFDGKTGMAAAGFPKYTGGWSVFTPAIGDVLGTKHTDVAAMTREGYLFIWGTAGNGCSGNSEAWHWHQNDYNDGLYGSDTRPPSAVSDLKVAKSGSNDILTWTAAGNDWRCGTPAGYQLFTSTAPITQSNVVHAARLPLGPGCCPASGGTKWSITIPASENKGYLALRATDSVAHVGPLQLTATTPPLTSSAQLSAAIAPAVVVAGVAIVGMLAPRRRRRRAA